MKTFLKVLAFSLALLMLIGVFAACKKNADDPNGDQPKPENNTPLVVGDSPFSSKFSPFFATTAYDQDASAMTQLGLLNADRTGAIIQKGIKGETIAYNGKDYTYYGPADLTITENKDGTVYYDFVLREDLKFSDGTPVTIDDVIFSMYVLCDPTYDGSSTLYSVPIEGMDAYRKGFYTIISAVLEECPEEMNFLNSFVDKGLIDRLKFVRDSEFVRCTYTDAIDILQKSGEKFEYPISWGSDLQTEHERYLTEKHFGKPVFVTDWPKEIKAFYMRMNEDGKTVAAADLLVPAVGELCGGSQREELYDVLKARIEELGMNPEDYWWYLELRKYGTAEHAGFGMGFERMIMYLTGIANIRDVLPFPRTTGNADF